MNLEQQVRLLKILPRNNLQEVKSSFQEKTRDPKLVQLENNVNSLMNQKLMEQNKKPDPVLPKNNVRHVSTEEALKELAALLKSTDNKS